MAYPVNPPVGPFMRRAQLLQGPKLKWAGPGILGIDGFWFWEPDRIVKAPDDWFVGPYPSLYAVRKARARFLAKEAEGPAVRTWGA